MTILLCNPALSYWLAVICNRLKFSMMCPTDYLRECQKVVSVRGLVLVEPKVEVKSDGLADTEYVWEAVSKRTVKCSGLASFLAEAKPELI